MEWLWLSLLGLFFIQLVGLMLPGADFVVVVRATLKYNRNYAILTVLGVTTGVSIYATTVVFALDMVGQYFGFLDIAITLFGIGYLSYMGWQCLRSHQPSLTIDHHQVIDTTKHNPYLNGLFCNLSNPKVMVFFASLLPIYVHKSPMLGFHLAIIAVMTVATFLWFGFVALCIDRPTVKSALNRYIHTIEKIFGILLLLFALALLIKVAITVIG